MGTFILVVFHVHPTSIIQLPTFKILKLISVSFPFILRRKQTFLGKKALKKLKRNGYLEHLFLQIQGLKSVMAFEVKCPCNMTQGKFIEF